MRMVNMHDAKTQLSRLVQEVVSDGEPIVIARAGVPLVRLAPLDQQRRTGFLADMVVPDDFDQIASDRFAARFQGSP